MIVVKNQTKKALISANIGILWNPSLATPDGWSVISELNGYFAMADSNRSYTSGSGAASHSHTYSTTLNNSGDHNNHSVSVSQTDSCSPNTTITSNYYGGYFSSPHQHNAAATQGTPSTAGAHSHTLSGTSGTASNYPYYTTLTWLYTTDNKYKIPTNGIVMWGGGNAPSGFSLCDGSNNTPDLRTYGFIIGGTSSETGGNNTHNHSTGASSESGEHSHSVPVSRCASGGNSNVAGGTSDNSGEEVAPKSHTHAGVTVTSANGGKHSHYLDSMEQKQTLPPYYSLYFIMALSDRDIPSGAITIWNSDNNPPSGWSNFSAANGKFIKYGTPETTGGSESHSHLLGSVIANNEHSHPQKGFEYGTPDIIYAIGGIGRSPVYGWHSHNANLSLGTGGNHTHILSTTTTNSSSAFPPYKKIRLIRKD